LVYYSVLKILKQRIVIIV